MRIRITSKYSVTILARRFNSFSYCLCTHTHTHTHIYIYIYIYIHTHTHMWKNLGLNFIDFSVRSAVRNSTDTEEFPFLGRSVA